MLLINILILFFICLLLFQIMDASNILEGLENQYQSYDTSDPSNALILAQKNAGNISYLKERLDEFSDMYQQVQDLSGNVQDLQNQVNGIMQSQQDYANQMTGGSPPDISGAVDDSDITNTTTNTE